MNTGYIQVVLFLLSFFVYMNNNAIASELSLKKSKNISSSKDSLLSYIPDKIFKPSNSLICTNPDEIEKAEKIMGEAIERLKEHAIHSNDYRLYHHYDEDVNVYRKRHKYLIVDKIDVKIHNTDKYEEIIDTLFNFNNDIYSGGIVVEGKVVREYNPNLVMIQKRYIDVPNKPFEGYFYSIATKHQVSEDTTVIALTSANINDYNHIDKNLFRNIIVESANSFETDICSENYIRRRYLNKMFVHLSGYIIKKKSKYIQITCINALEVDNRNAPKFVEERFKSDKLTILVSTRNKYSMK
ncbi:fam-a protein [Plasmodium berghei]|uniref:Fam-a protein n=2 Tax=Plasmodium berghei TaxID=5821 RepID=A0A509AKB9_PLABA|nr:fam-a protein [Plasmodium berghei ANKA]XP_034420490.1 fam-a protein [Plasmodium berghei ANKA]XP_034421802.1 fam-a protein [Plasmodium berghei ANKA]SBW38280.1 fam-a protein [Plasmodium berghei]SCL81859.1 fam-a protein [Plasmodium berghei]SCL85023.1 fam-a protein [Plasmodium berghei]SCL85834.1 fam-a protein [Plasmodium berghei]SCM17439.1 fam-a protein [Plasmodium berghei]|eukprot:XP_034420250.1 fam-a protein [Plasmodium berghei ANKA]